MLAHMAYPPAHLRLPVLAKQESMKATSRPKSLPAQSQPVDPQELARRLSVVLAEQRAHSDRKRRARTYAAIDLQQHSLSSRPNRNVDQLLPDCVGETESEIGIAHKTYRSSSHEETPFEHTNYQKPGSSSTRKSHDGLGNMPSYRHVPKVAASQFTSTTTAVSPSELGTIHPLSRQALSFHLDGPNASLAAKAIACDAAPRETNKALRRAQSMRERQYKRNQVDVPILPRTSELGTALYPLSPGPFENGVDDESRDARRMSTGTMLGRSEPRPVEPFEMATVLLSPEKSEIVYQPSKNRVDWTQSDESTKANAAVQPAFTRLELRKTDSKWKLRGRLGSFGRHSKEDKLLTPPPEESVATDTSARSPIIGFFSLFKR
ncbi:hypothetical protein E4U15_000036 [Claviceps sp. LM218 group G6]|nr:hypothetical protein E4U15_000036 [Claviceps sp. LM218 group G6]